MWWWILTILFFLISVAASAVVYFSLKRINQYENLLVQIQQVVEFASVKMKEVDSQGHYESDDETGFFFTQLKDLQKVLDDIFETEQLQEKVDAKDKK